MRQYKTEQKKPFILLIDDDPENLHTVTRILHKEGYNIMLAVGGILAMKAIKDGFPDLMKRFWSK